MKIPIEISARHVHLSEKDFEKLFGKETKLESLHSVSQPGQFAAIKEVELVNNNNKLKARIIGPLRKESQIEISLTDAYRLKMKQLPPLRISGDLGKAPSLIIEGPEGNVNAKVIIAKRHLHLSEKQAKKLRLKNGQNVKIKVLGERGLIFENITVRAGDGNEMAFQIDTDEGNAAGIMGKSFGEIIR